MQMIYIIPELKFFIVFKIYKILRQYRFNFKTMKKFYTNKKNIFLIFHFMVKSLYKSLSLNEKEDLRKAVCLLRFRKEFPKIGDTTYFSYEEISNILE